MFSIETNLLVITILLFIAVFVYNTVDYIRQYKKTSRIDLKPRREGWHLINILNTLAFVTGITLLYIHYSEIYKVLLGVGILFVLDLSYHYIAREFVFNKLNEDN